MNEHERQRIERYNLRAALYGHYLRRNGYAADEAARLVIERYPATRPKLQRIAEGRGLHPEPEQFNVSLPIKQYA